MFAISPASEAYAKALLRVPIFILNLHKNQAQIEPAEIAARV
jgi:hypothetical protein